MNNECTLENVLNAQELMDDMPAPNVGRSYWNPEKQELEYFAPVKQFSLDDLKKIFPIK